jgi:hypothetical protein
MLEVDKVTSLLFLKMVSLVAPASEAHECRKVLGGRFMGSIRARFEVRAGERFTLPYPMWARYAVGQKVALADVARHPFGPHWQPVT